jgi:hypothetical protein
MRATTRPLILCLLFLIAACAGSEDEERGDGAHLVPHGEATDLGGFVPDRAPAAAGVAGLFSSRGDLLVIQAALAPDQDGRTDTPPLAAPGDTLYVDGDSTRALVVTGRQWRDIDYEMCAPQPPGGWIYEVRAAGGALPPSETLDGRFATRMPHPLRGPEALPASRVPDVLPSRWAAALREAREAGDPDFPPEGDTAELIARGPGVAFEVAPSGGRTQVLLLGSLYDNRHYLDWPSVHAFFSEDGLLAQETRAHREPPLLARDTRTGADRILFGLHGFAEFDGSRWVMPAERVLSGACS